MPNKPPKNMADTYRETADRFQRMADEEQRPDYKADLLYRAKHARELAENEAKKLNVSRSKRPTKSPKSR